MDQESVKSLGPRKSRRPRGAGGILRRKPFLHVCLVYRGRYQEASALSTRPRDAHDLLEKCRAAIREGTFTSIAAIRDGTPDPALETVATVATQWLERSAKVTRDAKGHRLAGARVALYLVPFLGKIEAQRLTADDLMDYRGWLQQTKAARMGREGKRQETSRPLSTQTVRHILSDLRALVLWAEQRGLVPRGILPKHYLPRAPERPLRSLSADQQAAVRAVDDPYGFAVRIMIDSGVRWSELCRLTRDDLVDGALLVHGMTKSRRMRSVPVQPALIAEVKGHVGKLVPYGPADVSWFNRAVRDRSDVAAFSAHACRHSFGFNYMARGGNILALKEQMGHSTVELTAHYAKPTQELVRADAAKVHLRAAR